MTENETIKEIETSLELAEMCKPNREREKEIKAYKMAIKALEEVRAYRAIGTIDEFKALKEKNTPKKIAYQIGKNGLKHEKCPTCGSFHVFGKHCTECGQAVDYD